jgi:hypothetical protein
VRSLAGQLDKITTVSRGHLRGRFRDATGFARRSSTSERAGQAECAGRSSGIAGQSFQRRSSE